MSRKHNSPRTWMHAAFSERAVLPVSRLGSALYRVYTPRQQRASTSRPCTAGHWDCDQCDASDCTIVAYIVVTRATMRRGAPVEVVECSTWDDAVAYADDHNRSAA